MIDIQKNHVQ